VLNIINYSKAAEEEGFYKSSFWKKNKMLLLMLYLWEKGVNPLDYIFKIIRLWDFPEKDLRIIREDWKRILDMIKEGRAHELSERFTLYLGACPKGASKKSTRKQPYGPSAMQRAFSLKSKYLNMIIERSLEKKLDSAPAVLVSDYGADEDFEDVILRKISMYYGMTEEELKGRLGIEYSPRTKHRYYLLAKAMLGIKANKIEEFEKADIALKAIRLKRNNRPKESMSFKQIKFKEIVGRFWEESDFYNELNRRFFFIIFKESDHDKMVFFKAMFWSIPEESLLEVKKVWKDAKKKISIGKYDDFVRISDDRIAHVRPKARNSQDVMETPQGTFEKKKCFWLNAAFIETQLRLDS
jgi:DNA mismatch repair protein MutH